MKYKVGDRVQVKSLDWYNENKDNYGAVYAGNGFAFWNYMAGLCGEIMTISSIKVDPEDSNKGYYFMENSEEKWTDEMIEGLAEYPKIAIQGDPTRGVSVIDALIALGGENDKDSIATTKHACYFIDHEGKIRSRLLENLPEGFKLYTLEEWRKENMEKENADKKELLLGLVETQKGQELIPHKDYEIKQDGDKFYLVKKKKEYPKTYKECCKVINYALEGETIIGYKASLLRSLQKLLICRDAYWKIAGANMGLGRSWKPNWTSFEGYPAIYMYRYQITLSVAKDVHHCLVFPTEEMRDAFYENFDPDIEICKELL